MSPPIDFSLRRRTLLAGTAAAAVVAAATRNKAAAHGTGVPVSAGETKSSVTLVVNGRERELMVDNRVTLLDALREHLKLTGTKKGCDHGQCGACTCTVNGERINSCLSLAVMHDGDEDV